jgi:hypothetical protein
MNFHNRVAIVPRGAILLIQVRQSRVAPLPDLPSEDARSQVTMACTWRTVLGHAISGVCTGTVELVLVTGYPGVESGSVWSSLSLACRRGPEQSAEAEVSTLLMSSHSSADSGTEGGCLCPCHEGVAGRIAALFSPASC